MPNGSSDSGRSACSFSLCSSTFDEPQKVQRRGGLSVGKDHVGAALLALGGAGGGAGAEAARRGGEPGGEVVLDHRAGAGGHVA